MKSSEYDVGAKAAFMVYVLLHNNIFRILLMYLQCNCPNFQFIEDRMGSESKVYCLKIPEKTYIIVNTYICVTSLFVSILGVLVMEHI